MQNTSIETLMWKKCLAEGRRLLLNILRLLLISCALKPCKTMRFPAFSIGVYLCILMATRVVHAHTLKWFVSFSHLGATLPNQQIQRTCMVNFSICTHACVTNAAASEKQRMLSLCPSIACSLCAVAFEAAFAPLSLSFHAAAAPRLAW